MTELQNDDLETHYGPIDEQHREVVARLDELVNAIHHGPKAAIRPALDAFMTRCLEHFNFEERLMTTCTYPQMTAHTEAHATFIADVRRFSAELASNGPTEAFRRWATGRLLTWFRLHIKANDMGLARALQNAANRRRT